MTKEEAPHIDESPVMCAIERLMHKEAAQAIEHELYMRDNPDCPSTPHRKPLVAWHHASAHLLHIALSKNS